MPNVIVTRTFDAPRAFIFDAFTDPGLVGRWWGPKGFTTPFCNIDLRVGGTVLSCMRSPEGKDFWSTGVYREILRPERIVSTDSFADEKGKVVPASYYGMSAEFPMEMLIQVTLFEEQGKTKLVLEHIGIPASEHENCAAGWNESFDKLADFAREYVASKKVA
ncbi:MAG TPA: ATPase [Bdellovibrionales bacterium]|nr:MAG: ATPase [Bdellovibrionales bacterium GWB1_52_6]OFZ03380.1 MAG: ATPase [Bdellovibrionales bacterium GWA1_52_35]HAR43950.1 ATPase [Bdellovibrionales bacterium]HCM40963.1 ATPase [Bdellovibrionales bacterium]